MIKTQVVREGKKPVAVILDYNACKKLCKLAQDRPDCAEATSKKLASLKVVKKSLGLKRYSA